MASIKHQDQIRITAQCLCRAHSFAATIPRSSLPLQASACHCNSCRHLTGALYSIDTPWPGSYDAIRNSTLKKYNFSERLKVLFCGTCSSTMFWEQPDDAAGHEYGVLTGVLLNEGPENLVRLTSHIFVSDTLDGGATPWLQKPNWDGKVVKLWAQRAEKSEQLAHGWPGKTLPAADWKSDTVDVPVHCHCKGVDLVYRQAAALESNASKQREGLSRYVDPISRKSVAGLDACDSCRTSAGIDFISWGFTSLKHVGFPAQGSKSEALPGFPASPEELYNATVRDNDDRDLRLGTLSIYESSDGIKRYFCSRCSACIFYAADKRHDVVNIAMGVLDSPEGSRAEGAFMWLLGGPVQHRDDVLGGWREGWVEAVEADSEAWRLRRNFPEWWRLRK